MNLAKVTTLASYHTNCFSDLMVACFSISAVSAQPGSMDLKKLMVDGLKLDLINSRRGTPGVKQCVETLGNNLYSVMENFENRFGVLGGWVIMDAWWKEIARIFHASESVEEAQIASMEHTLALCLALSSDEIRAVTDKFRPKGGNASGGNDKC